MVSPLVFSPGSVNKLQARLVVFRPGPDFILEKLTESLWEQHGTTKQGPFLSPGWSSVCAVWCDVPFPLGIPQVGDLWQPVDWSRKCTSLNSDAAHLQDPTGPSLDQATAVPLSSLAVQVAAQCLVRLCHPRGAGQCHLPHRPIHSDGPFSSWDLWERLE